MSRAIMAILGGAVTSVAPGLATLAQAAPIPIETPSNATDAPAAAGKIGEPGNGACLSQNTRSIIVCAQRPQGYRLDPSIMEANREAERSDRSATSATPVAQAACSTLPTGCPGGLESVDWVNVAIVAATTAVKTAKGDDWTKTFKTGSSDEYQLYRQAKEKREARNAAREAAAVKREAEETERLAASKGPSK